MTHESEAQIHETGLNPSLHIKEVWFPGTHSCPSSHKIERPPLASGSLYCFGLNPVESNTLVAHNFHKIG